MILNTKQAPRRESGIIARGYLGATPQPHLDLHASADFLGVRKDWHHAEALEECGLPSLLVSHLAMGR
jgi:hypothetical protein